MKNKFSESIMKLNQSADILVYKKSWKYASQNNSNGEEMKKKTYKFELIGKLFKKFSHFS